MEDTNEWIWPEELDALIAAPKHHTLLFENDFVRVLDTCIRPGETTNVHTHRYPATLYILSWSDFIRYDENGNTLLDSRTLANPPKAGSALWSDSLSPHSLQNVGNRDIHVINVEQKKG